MCANRRTEAVRRSRFAHGWIGMVAHSHANSLSHTSAISLSKETASGTRIVCRL